MTNSAAMVSGASFRKTSVIFPGSTKPSATTRQSTESAMTSGAAHSRMKAMSVIRITAKVRPIWRVIEYTAPRGARRSMNGPERFGKVRITETAAAPEGQSA